MTTTIFWSWQSDRDPKLHHYFVRDALKDACKLIAIDPDYQESARPEVAVNTNCFAENSGGQCFASALPFTPLDEFLRKGIAAIRAMGGKGPIGIKLGAGDLTDTVLPGQYQSQRLPAVSARADVGEELETWTSNERRALLFRFWNALMDAYGRPPARSVAEFEQVASVAPLSK